MSSLQTWHNFRKLTCLLRSRCRRIFDMLVSSAPLHVCGRPSIVSASKIGQVNVRLGPSWIDSCEGEAVVFLLHE
jgi:hypothetical protein